MKDTKEKDETLPSPSFSLHNTVAILKFCINTHITYVDYARCIIWSGCDVLLISDITRTMPVEDLKEMKADYNNFFVYRIACVTFHSLDSISTRMQSNTNNAMFIGISYN